MFSRTRLCPAVQGMQGYGRRQLFASVAVDDASLALFDLGVETTEDVLHGEGNRPAVEFFFFVIIKGGGVFFFFAGQVFFPEFIYVHHGSQARGEVVGGAQGTADEIVKGGALQGG